MLKRCILAENRKLHASPIWAMFFVLPILSATYGTFNYLQNLEILTDGWDRHLQLSKQHRHPHTAMVQPLDAAHAVLLDAVLSRDGVGVCGLPLAA